MLTRLAHLTTRHRWPVIGAWLVLTLFGAFAAQKVSTRWYQSFLVPGKPAYDASQRMLQAFGAGVRPPDVVVFHARGDATASKPIEEAMRRAAMTMPGARTTSYFSTGSLAYASRDRHTTFEEVYPPGPAQLTQTSGAQRMRAAAERGLLGYCALGVVASSRAVMDVLSCRRLPRATAVAAAEAHARMQAGGIPRRLLLRPFPIVSACPPGLAAVGDRSAAYGGY